MTAASSTAIHGKPPVLRSPKDPSDDPHRLVPATFPSHPRVLCSAADIARTRADLKRHEWVRLSLQRLRDGIDKPFALPDTLPNPADTKLNNKLAGHNLRCALAFLLTDEQRYLDLALKGFRLLTRGYLELPLRGTDNRAGGGGLAESRFNVTLGQTYDLLAASGLAPQDDALFREALNYGYDISNRSCHRTCGNHSTWSLAGRLSFASALGDRLGIHEVVYGSPCPVRNQDVPDWRYGLAHQLGHDILADGFHWERTPGYHFYTMMAFTEAAFFFGNLGVDLFHAKLPALLHSEGFDLHRAYGPEGTRQLKTMYDAPFYHCFTNGDISLLHDSGLANLRGAYIWGPIYEIAYDATHDPKYAWLLHRMEHDYPADHPQRKHPGVPMSLQPDRGDMDFVRLRGFPYPQGAYSLARDMELSQTGRHLKGCTQFPTTGVTILRNDVADENAPGAYLFWGPHSAGHQSPAALHIDLHAHGRPVTTAPAAGGYEDANYLTWVRQTIAHNTLTVDQKPMFPYDQPTESIWEADGWRRWNSDGVCDLFQPGEGFHAARVSNQAVYPGVRLDRTVVLTRDYAIDCFRVFSDTQHDYDLAFHILGRPDVSQLTASPVDLGDARGYMHLKNARRLSSPHGVFWLDWTNTINSDSKRMGLQSLNSAGGSLILADTPSGGEGHNLGELHACADRFVLLNRTRAARAVFITLWRFTLDRHAPAIESFAGNPDTPIELAVLHKGKSSRWMLPLQNQPVTCA